MIDRQTVEIGTRLVLSELDLGDDLLSLGGGKDKISVT